MSGPREGLAVTHRRYIPYSHAHYAGDLVDGAYVLGLFGDAATELCIRSDGDEGLFASYSDVQFRAPVRAGDVLETTAVLTRAGTRSRVMDFEARVVCRGRPDRGESSAEVLPEPIVAVTATGTVVVSAPESGSAPGAGPAPAPGVSAPAAARPGDEIVDHAR
ncbi:3-aminobutyryl-CoA ammonia-lyase [Actinomadura hallensis]|uniref:3-aminobutyryl-CoA ammonia-lyase n=1 Tax=Actinomadura hallensis TaxID=337895 RepID=A0A543IFF2_9ACTN|nr:hotdog fold domain-containing protein [Actinomadura hallensis]TQM69315.1 3-aminobutyryl-CoA ammonia-lyase [Actinomadura hallensis]HLV75325.1 hotdog fold domain-containing protein [Vulgatibacteraceae bacterium]